MTFAWDRQTSYDCVDGNVRFICTYAEDRNCIDTYKGDKSCTTSRTACELRKIGIPGIDFMGDLGDSRACRDACAREVGEGECADPSKWRRY